MANSSIILTNLDFDTLKTTFKSYLRSQDRFQDYDFEGSNMNVLLDLLSYNTYLQSFYLNMVGSEMFLDTATLRDSVVSHAKELNYTPRSFKSAEATVDIVLTDTDLTRRSVTIPKGTSFSSRIGANNFTFTTDQIIVTNQSVISGGKIKFTAPDVILYEGDYVTETFAISALKTSKILISNKRIDTSSLSVTVIEDVGATVHSYQKASSLFGLSAESKVFFVQGGPGETYEIIFGDGVIGRTPKDNSVVIVEYRVSSGELPNGAFTFNQDGPIDGIADVSVVTKAAATSGSVSESIESIKYNAPRHFTTQERAVTTEDYGTLLKLNFPEVNGVIAYGGEEANPPQFGKVFLSVDLKDVDGLPDVKKDQFYKFLKPRSPVSIDPVFIDPQYLYVSCNAIVRYNINMTSLNVDDIRTKVMSAILSYSATNLNGFAKTLRYSRLVQAIDGCHSSIVSNELQVQAVKYITPIIGQYQNITIDYGIPILRTIPDSTDHPLSDSHSIESSSFVYDGQTVYIEDDGAGLMRIVSPSGSTHRKIKDIGDIDYDTGIVNISSLKIDSFTGSHLKFFATPASKDIFSTKNTILNINETDISVSIEQIRE